MRTVWALLKGIGLSIGILAVVASAHALLWTEQYAFPEPSSFAGDVWYNPYAELEHRSLLLGNFQVQSDAWAGITNGRNNSSERVFEIYGSLGYHVISISDYMAINRFVADSAQHYPVYEHGYGAWKTHQLCLGARSVRVLDFPLFQTRSNKQHVLNALQQDCGAVAIAHPSLRNAYSREDLARLTGFDLIEAVSKFKMSMSHWDAALSAGRPAFLISNDDAHDLDRPQEYGRCATVVAAKALTPDAVWDALKAGSAYAYVPNCPEKEQHAEKCKRFLRRPELRAVDVRADTTGAQLLCIRASLPISSVRWIGPHSDTLAISSVDSRYDSAVFRLPREAAYVRAELDFESGDVLYLNPVIRTRDGKLQPPTPAAHLPVATAAGRVAFVLFLFGAALRGVWVSRRRLRLVRA